MDPVPNAQSQGNMVAMCAGCQEPFWAPGAGGAHDARLGATQNDQRTWVAICWRVKRGRDGEPKSACPHEKR